MCLAKPVHVAYASLHLLRVVSIRVLQVGDPPEDMKMRMVPWLKIFGNAELESGGGEEEVVAGNCEKGSGKAYLSGQSELAKLYSIRTGKQQVAYAHALILIAPNTSTMLSFTMLPKNTNVFH